MSEQTIIEARADIAVLTELLEAEIADIKAGGLAAVVERVEVKTALVARLDGAGPVIEAALGAEDDASATLREDLAALAALISRDAAMLGRMRETTAGVARDLERLRARHGLGGLYGADGNRSAGDTLSRAPMDKSV